MRVVLIILAILVAGLTWYIFRTEIANKPVAEISSEQVQLAVNKYLSEHPEVVVNAIQKMKEEAEASQRAAAEERLREKEDALFRNANDPVVGNLQGDVTMVEFFDYRCPYCKKVTPDLEALIEEDKKLRVVFKEFPILGPQSVIAAKVALAAQRQGKYAEIHRAMMAHKGDFTEAALIELAKSNGIDGEKLATDMKDPAIQGQIDANLALGRDLGITGTPSFIVGRKIAPGAIGLEDMKKLIAESRGNQG